MVLCVSVIYVEHSLHFDVHWLFSMLIERFKKNSLSTNGQSSLIIVMVELDSLLDTIELVAIINKKRISRDQQLIEESIVSK